MYYSSSKCFDLQCGQLLVIDVMLALQVTTRSLFFWKATQAQDIDGIVCMSSIATAPRMASVCCAGLDVVILAHLWHSRTPFHPNWQLSKPVILRVLQSSFCSTENDSCKFIATRLLRKTMLTAK